MKQLLACTENHRSSRWSPKFICSSMRSPIVLSDGRVTTCTTDCEGQNSFADIYKHDFDEVTRRYAALRLSVMEDPIRAPHCLTCFSMLPQSKKIGLPHAEWMCVENDDARKRQFLGAFDPQAVTMNVELSSKCNLRCIGCAVAKQGFRLTRDVPNIDMEHLLQWVAAAGKRIKCVRLYHMGETWAHPRWADFSRTMKAQNPNVFLFTSTNGMLMFRRGVFDQLATAGIDHIMFSVHGTRQSIAERYMGKSFRIERAMEAARRTAEIRHRHRLRLLLSWRYVLFAWNDSEEEIREACALAERFGFDEIHFTLNCYPQPGERFNAKSKAWKSLREKCALAWSRAEEYQRAAPMVALYPTMRGKLNGGELSATASRPRASGSSCPTTACSPSIAEPPAVAVSREGGKAQDGPLYPTPGALAYQQQKPQLQQDNEAPDETYYEVPEDQLAIHGGVPVRTTDFGPRWVFDETDRQQLMEVMDRAPTVWHSGFKVREFSNLFAKTYGLSHVIPAGSGTAAIHAAIGALDLDPMDEVITTPITDVGTVIGILMQNLIPVFVDWDATMFNMAPSDIERKITERTRAILVVHIFGNPCDMDAIMAIAKRHRIPVIEDCAQAHLAKFGGRMVGTFGDLACFSLGLKTLTTDQGGFVLTNDSRHAWNARGFLSKGSEMIDGAWTPYCRLGTYSPMTDLQAAIGVAQLAKLEAATRVREMAAAIWDETFANFDGFTLPLRRPNDRSTHYIYVYHLDPDRAGVTLKDFVAALRAEGVQDAFGPYLKGRPLHLSPLFADARTYGNSGFPFRDGSGVLRIDYRALRLPVAERMLSNIGFFHMRNTFSEADVRDIAKAISKVASAFARRAKPVPYQKRQDESQTSSLLDALSSILDARS